MSEIISYLKYAETTLGAYGVALRLGRGNDQAYVDAGMAASEAIRFDANWQVLAQQDLSDGFSATLFQEVNVQGAPIGQKVLAIRGTESSHWGVDYLADIVNVAVLGANAGFAQYSSLESFYQSLIGQQKLQASEGFVVTGHSLGGFLAQAFAAKHSSVSAGYTYNSPGFSVLPGVATNVGTQLLKMFGLTGTIPNEKVFNVRAIDGLSVTAGLGQVIGATYGVRIEAGSAIHNHSISTLTDALTFYELYARIDADARLVDIGSIFLASSNQTSKRLEAGLDSLRRLVLGSEVVQANQTGHEDRDSYYQNIVDLISSGEFRSIAGRGSVTNLTGHSASELEQLAHQDIAYRYALVQLNPIVIVDLPSLYQKFNADGQLELSGSLNVMGLSSEYLVDRARMLVWKNRHFISDGLGALRGDTLETYRYSDKALGDGSGGELAFTVVGSRNASIGIPAHITFGSDQSETLAGGDVAAGDHLYGGGGNDVLDGQGGNDYLEGNAGDDTLLGGADDDVLVGGAGLDTFVYNDGDGFDVISGADASDRLLFNGQVLGGGSKSGEGVYEDASGVVYMWLSDGSGSESLLIDGSILIEDFIDGDLGLVFGGEIERPDAPDGEYEFIYIASPRPEGFDPDAEIPFNFERFVNGTTRSDLFISSGTFEVVGRSGNDSAIFEDGDVYGVPVDMGSGDDAVDMSGSTGGVPNASSIVGGGGSDYIIGSQGADAIFGDNYRAISADALEEVGGAYAGFYFLDGFSYNSSAESDPNVTYLPAGYGAYGDVPRFYFSEEFEPVAEAVLIPEGVVIAGTLEQMLAEVIGESGLFDDYVEAGDGDDSVVAGSGSDTVHGGEGKDVLVGDYATSSLNYHALGLHFGELAYFFGAPGDDYLDGGEGDDILTDTDGGNEILVGGAGNDTITSGDGPIDPESVEPAHNVIHGDAGNDTVFASNATGGFDFVDGGDGDDQITVSVMRYRIDVDDDGIDDFTGVADGHAIVFGGDGNDVLAVNAESAIVDGGAGNDQYLVSGESFVIYDESGVDTLQLLLPDLAMLDAMMEAFPVLDPEDQAELDEVDQLASTVVLREGGDLLFEERLWGDGEEVQARQIRVSDWFESESNRIERIATGGPGDLVYSAAQFESWGALQFGGGGADDIVLATEYTDRAFGRAGADLISTGGGNDRISGDAGDDELYGGTGDDTYYYAAGDGHDAIHEESGSDEIRLGPGIEAGNVTAEVGESGIALTIGSGRIDVVGGSRGDPGVERLRFADGSTVAVSALLGPEPNAVVDPDPVPDPEPDPEPVPGPDTSGGHPAPVPTEATTSPGVPAPPEPPTAPLVPALPVSVVPDPFPSPVVVVLDHDASAQEAPVTSAGPVADPVGAAEAILPSTPLPAPASFAATQAFESIPDLAPRTESSTALVRSLAPLSPTLPDSPQPNAGSLSSPPLDMETLQGAIDAFEAQQVGEGPAQDSPMSGAQRVRLESLPEGQSSPALTSWALTNALLQFHLERPGAPGVLDGIGDGVSPANVFNGLGIAQGLAPLGPSAYGRPTQLLQTFSGLQEGFQRLA